MQPLSSIILNLSAERIKVLFHNLILHLSSGSDPHCHRLNLSEFTVIRAVTSILQ